MFTRFNLEASTCQDINERRNDREILSKRIKKQIGYTDGHSKAGFALNVGLFKLNNAMIYFQGKTCMICSEGLFKTYSYFLKLNYPKKEILINYCINNSDATEKQN